MIDLYLWRWCWQVSNSVDVAFAAVRNFYRMLRRLSGALRVVHEVERNAHMLQVSCLRIKLDSREGRIGGNVRDQQLVVAVTW
jgi:hypothetical protein